MCYRWTYSLRWLNRTQVKQIQPLTRILREVDICSEFIPKSFNSSFDQVLCWGGVSTLAVSRRQLIVHPHVAYFSMRQFDQCWECHVYKCCPGLHLFLVLLDTICIYHTTNRSPVRLYAYVQATPAAETYIISALAPCTFSIEFPCTVNAPLFCVIASLDWFNI